MPYSMRQMRREDVAQVTGIDREAFPTIWPPVNYHRELQNSLAHYIVVCDDRRTAAETETPPVPRKGISRVIRQLFNRDRLPGNQLPPSNRQYIAGFAGLWIMADEAHLTSIAVRKCCHRQGIGELLLISAINLATELKARIITLEVRASNTVPQALYRKYGFNQVGLRRGYYVDDKEDAVLMSTEDISSPSFQSRLEPLKQAHFRKLGITQYEIAR